MATAKKESKKQETKNQLIIGKSDAKMLRGTSSNTRTVYTIGFSSEAVLAAGLDFFKAEGVKPLDKGVEKNGFWEVRFEAIEQSMIRTALRLFKNSGIAVYRGADPTYVKKASDPGIVLVKKLAKRSKEVVDMAKKIMEAGNE